MRRREFITLLGGTVAWPLSAPAQQPTPVIGFLNSTSPQAWASFLAAFIQGLKQAGYVDGQNVVIEYRWAENQNDRLPSLAAELVRYPVSVIVTSGGDHVVQAAKAAAPATPIVSTFGFDPVEHGLAASLNRPGGNITGVSVFSSVLIAKRVELLRELLPKVATVAFLANPANPSAIADANDIAAAAQTLAESVIVLNAATEQECEVALAKVSQQGAGALAIQSDPFYNSIIDHLIALAKRYAIPAVIAALGGNNPTLAARAATRTIPIVFNTGADPVRSGLVPSLSRPGGNVTGVSFLVEELGAKTLGLLHELVPKAMVIGVLINPSNPEAEREIMMMQEAARTLGLRLEIIRSATANESIMPSPSYSNEGLVRSLLLPIRFSEVGPHNLSSWQLAIAFRQLIIVGNMPKLEVL